MPMLPFDIESILSGGVLSVISILLITAVIFVNGWTDAPNAIATCISTRSLTPAKGILLAAIMNFAGVFIMSMINRSVAKTVYGIARFGEDSKIALAALSASLLSIVIWAVVAWFFGIPTSESHALIAGITGASFAVFGSFKGLGAAEWKKVLWGIILSVLIGFGLGLLIVTLTRLIVQRFKLKGTTGVFRRLQVLSSAFMAFMHGAQDGQKFIGVFLLSAYISNNRAKGGEFHIPIWLMLFTALVISLGTATGGYRIIKSVSMDMVKLKAYQGFSADLAGSVSLLLSSFAGLPVSTTQAKTSAIMGVGASRGLRFVNWRIAGNMVATWLLTFPGCAFISYFVTKLFFVLIGKS